MSVFYTVYLKPTLQIAQKLYFNSAKFDFTERAPLKEGFLLSANHPNAAVDPMNAGIKLDTQLYFLTRGDVFTTAFNRFWLAQFHCIPIYRKTDDENYKEKNNETFDICNENLKNNKPILIFPESICVQEYRLRPLKGGMALILFTAAEHFEFKKEFYALPFGQNYYAFTKFRSDYYGAYGEPVRVNDYKALYLQDKEAAFKAFNDEVAKRMKENMWIVEDAEDDDFFVNIRQILREKIFESDNEANTNNRNRFLKFKALGEAISDLKSKENDVYLQLKLLTQSFKEECESIGVRSKHINHKIINSRLNFSIFSKIFLLAFTAPIALAGYILNYLPYKITTHLSATKVKKVEFYASVNFVVGWILFLWYYLIFGGIFWGLTNWKLALAFVFLSPILGLFSFNYYILWKNLKSLLQLTKHFEKAKSLLNDKGELFNLGDELLKYSKERLKKLK